jgi:maleate cis-trans isomerase
MMPAGRYRLTQEQGAGAMTDWSKRFGWIVPSWNTVTEFEVGRLTPPDISEHFARIAHTEDSEAAFERMAREAPVAAGLLADASVDAICYACTAGSFFKGYDDDRRFAGELTAAVGRPVLTMADALVRASRHLGFKRIAVAAPYEAWLMDRLVAFLEEAGFEVLKSAGLGHQANILYEPGKALELATTAWHPDADGLVMSCGNFRTLEAIDEIEETIGRPVVTSVQASMWGLLEIAGIKAARDDAGILLRDAAASAAMPGTP